METVAATTPKGENLDNVAQSPANTAFTSYEAQLTASDIGIQLRILRMQGSTMLFINNLPQESINELAVAMSKDGKTLATSIFSRKDFNRSEQLAMNMSRRFGRQYFVSFNVPFDRITYSLFEKALADYIKQNEYQFA